MTPEHRGGEGSEGNWEGNVFLVIYWQEGVRSGVILAAQRPRRDL